MDGRFLHQYLPFLLVRADTLLSRPMMAELASRGCSVAEWRILATLHDGDGLRISDLAELTILPQPTVSRWVDRLSDQGLVRRRESAHDGRSTMVHITAKGRRTADELMVLASSCMDGAAAVVPRRDLEALERALARVLARLDGEPGLANG